MLTNEITTYEALMSMVQTVQAKIKTASLCCEVLHDRVSDTNKESALYSTALQLEESWEQMELIQGYLSEHFIITENQA